MFIVGLCAGFFLLGAMLGLCGTMLFIRGWDSRGRVDTGQKPFGKQKELDPVVNTDRSFIDDIKQARLQGGLDPYQNETE